MIPDAAMARETAMRELLQRVVKITDPADAKIADFCNIRERDLVGREGRFVAEGTVVLRMLARSSAFQAKKILVLENRVEGIADILLQFDASIPIMVCSRDVIDAIAGFPMHRGVLAIGEARAPVDLHQAINDLDSNALVLVCNAISNHDNLGGLFRNAAAFCADLICLDEQCCDPLYRKAIRVSVGASLSVPYTRQASIEEIIAALDQAGFDIWALSPAGDLPIQEIKPGRRVALLVGTEGAGLPDALMDRLKTARIPQAADLDSLNVAMAAGIALFSIAAGQGRI